MLEYSELAEIAVEINNVTHPGQKRNNIEYWFGKKVQSGKTVFDCETAQLTMWLEHALKQPSRKADVLRKMTIKTVTWRNIRPKTAEIVLSTNRWTEDRLFKALHELIMLPILHEEITIQDALDVLDILRGMSVGYWPE